MGIAGAFFVKRTKLGVFLSSLFFFVIQNTLVKFFSVVTLPPVCKVAFVYDLSSIYGHGFA